MFGREGRNLRIETLTQLRWLALFGQLTTVLLIAFGFKFDVPLRWCLAVIGASAVLNVFVELYYPKSLRLEERPAMALLAFDILQLSSLLFLVGGLDNPFFILLLAPVTIAAVSLRPRQIVAIVFLALACASFLSIYHWPLPWFAGEALELPLLYRLGNWIAFLVAAAFICTYAAQVAHEARNLSLALTAAELVLERENHLSRLDGLAAAAAHELGTPLGTIAVVSRELSRANLPEEFAEDIDLLNDQAQRCRDILGRITSLASDEHPALDHMKLRHWIENVVDPFRRRPVAIEIGMAGDGDEPIVTNNPALSYGIANFLDNALNFAQAKVVVNASWTSDRITLRIFDDGPGFPDEILPQIGEPYLKTKTNRRLMAGAVAGMGLGIFISKTLLERTGAKLHFSNRNGAEVEIVWSRQQFESGPKVSLSPLSSAPDGL
jgi:two-component system, sensor histidine kinase RegB